MVKHIMGNKKYTANKIKHLLVDIGGRVSLRDLADLISTPDDVVSPNVVSMSLTGYRTGPRAADILKRLHTALERKLTKGV